MSKEMLGGCCVCSDERGWAENPLVYCDGKGCSVAVHQACYGIVNVPTGPWFCRKCESQERAVRVKCELCPSKDGALKRTDNNGWAHVVCALYIPEVRFGNVTTMEPIILQLIPQERFNRTCYICHEQGKAGKMTSGACMQCNKAGCKQQFHVTCAQALGLLCEEAGNQQDNVKYCGYCHHHNSQLKKGGNVKSIPPFKPISTDDHDSSPEKEDPNKMSISTGKKKSYLSTKTPTIVPGKPKSNSPSPYSVLNIDIKQEDDDENTSETPLKFGSTSSHNSETGLGSDTKNKFTTSNFVETVVTLSESVFGSDAKPTTSSTDPSRSKKRKTSIAGVKTVEESNTATTWTVTQPVSSTIPSLKNLSVSLSHLKTTVAVAATKNTISTSLTKTPPPISAAPKLTVYGTGTKITIAAAREDPKKFKTDAATVLTTAPPVNVNADKVPKASSPEANDMESSVKPIKPVLGRKPKKNQNRRPGAAKEEIDSPPLSPDRLRKKLPIKDEKDVKPLTTVNAPHMLGNQLNPSSSMAQKMHDSLHQEVEAHSIYSNDAHPNNLVGPDVPKKFRAPNNDKTATLSAANSLLSLGNPTAPTTTTATNSQNQALETLLERQWEQGSQFLMEQAQHFDIASLLSCLHQLKSENAKLEEQVMHKTMRRDHLLAVNARLSMPLGSVSHQSGPTSVSDIVNEPRTNGGDAHFQQQMHINPSPPVRGAPMPSVFANTQQRRPPIAQYQQQYSSQQQQQMNMNNSSASQSKCETRSAASCEKFRKDSYKSSGGSQPANVATTGKSAALLG